MGTGTAFWRATVNTAALLYWPDPLHAITGVPTQVCILHVDDTVAFTTLPLSLNPLWLFCS